jgi:autotransporter translocation and assembly factor TamB
MIILRKLAILFIILLGMLIFLISPIGMHTTLYLVSHFIPGELTYQSARGNFTKSLTLTKLEYKNQFIDIKSDYVQITWYPRRLIRREIAIDSIRVHNLNVEVYKNKSKSEKSTNNLSKTPTEFVPLNFSWVVTIRHSVISNLKLKYDLVDKMVNIPLVNLKGTLSRDNINLKLLVNQGIENQPSGTATIEGSIKDYIIKADYKNILKKQYYTLAAKGNQTHITAQVNTESYQANAVNINGEGYLSWNKTLTWSGHLQAEGLPFSSIQQLYPLSRGKFDLTFEGSFNGLSLNQHIVLSNATLWLINGARFDGQMRLVQQGKQLTSSMTFRNQTDYLTLNATVNHDINLSWNIHINELADLLMSFSGSLTSNGTIQKQSNRSAIQANVSLSNSSIGNLNVDQVNVKVDGTLNKHIITIDSRLQQAKISSQVVGKFTMNPWTWSGTVNQLNVYSSNIGSWKLSTAAALFLSAQETKISSLRAVSSDRKGQLSIDCVWSKLKRTMNGRLSFNMDTLSLPFLNIILKQVRANAVANGKSANLTASALSQSDAIQLTGTADWEKALRLKAKLSGKNILVIDTSEYTATVSPELTLLIRNRRVDLTGDIIIPRANITPDDFISVVSLPTDVTFVGIHEKNPSFFKLYTDLNIILGNNIFIKTQGIEGKLQGQLTIIKSPDQPFLGNGKLSISDASYNILGQKLTITKGHLNFVNSTLSNPNLDIQASRSLPTSLSSSSFGAERLTVGANLSGTLKQPQISLFSRPVQLSDIDIISYLLFGSSAGGATGGGGPASNAFILLQIANSLKSGKNMGDTNVIQKLQRGLGVTELGLQTQTDIDAIGNVVSSNQQFVAGAYLSPKLYFRYRYDLFYEVNIFEAQYLLSKHWIAQTNASALGNGADILYTIERGK